MNPILSALRQGDTVITSSEILSRDMHIRFGIAMRESGQTLWPRPALYSLHQWILHHWEQCWPETQLLHPVQNIILFKNVIDASPSGKNLLSATSAARLAQKANALMLHYRIQADASVFEDNAESRAFFDWFQDVQSRLSALHWTTFESAIYELIDYILLGKVTLPPRIILVGFVSKTPLIQQLFETLTQAGVHVTEQATAPEATDIQYRRLPTFDDEIKMVAAQIKSLLSPFIQDPSHAPRIGVVIPNVDKHRDRINEIFMEILSPGNRLPNHADRRTLWRFSKGVPLTDIAAISTAMDICSLTPASNSLHTLSRLLLNKRLFGGKHFEVLSRLDYWLRQNSSESLSLSALIYACEKLQIPIAENLFKKLAVLLNTGNNSALPSEWATRFVKRLDQFGWPAQDGITSEEYQIREAWKEAMGVYSSMDRQLGEISQPRAIAWLREVLYFKKFQYRVQYQQPVYILDLNDAPGLHFDHAFVLNTSIEVLPSQFSANPFIPIGMQKQANVPESNPEIILEHAQRLVTYLKGIADRVQFSCALYNDYGGEVTPSSLITQWPSDIAHHTTTMGVTQTIIANGLQTQVPVDDPVPAVIDPVQEKIRGGANIIKYYAQLPFLAYARCRLNLQPFPTITYGLSKRVQGQLVHAALEYFWRQVSTSSQLRSMSDQAIADYLAAGIHYGMTSKNLLPDWVYGKNLLELEKARVMELLLAWIELEKTRIEPFEVMYFEKNETITIADLPLKVVIDRVDKIFTAEGETKYLIIDYKTGANVDTSGWAIEALTEPQLPLYTIAIDQVDKVIPSVDGIAFAHLDIDKLALYTRNNWTAHLVPEKNSRNSNNPKYWEDNKRQWREAIEEISMEFMQGIAVADPGKFSKLPFEQDLVVFLRDDIERNQVASNP